MKNSLAGVIVLAIVIIAGASAWYYGESKYAEGWKDGQIDSIKPFTNLFNNVSFTQEESEEFQSIKNRLQVNNTDPAFPDNNSRTLEWISNRNSTSASWDKPMKSMEYLCFWRGQEGAGEWEAVVSIYNEPGSTTDYVVEVSRFTWHSLEVRLDGKIMASFPQVTNDTTSLGYATFHVTL